MMEFKRIFHELRQARQMSQEEVADKLHVSRQTISKWENGTANPDMDNLEAISALFAVSIDYLVTGTEKGDHYHKESNKDFNLKRLFSQENRDNLKKIIKDQWGAALIMWALLCMIGWSVVNIIVNAFFPILWVMVDVLYIICCVAMLIIVLAQHLYYIRKKRNTIICKISWIIWAANMAILGIYVMFNKEMVLLILDCIAK